MIGSKRCIAAIDATRNAPSIGRTTSRQRSAILQAISLASPINACASSYVFNSKVTSKKVALPEASRHQKATSRKARYRVI